jgi:hypothetical protein
MLRPYKFLIIPVVQQLDEDGNVTGEVQPQQPDTVYGLRGLREYAEGFEVALAEREAAMNGGSE